MLAGMSTFSLEDLRTAGQTAPTGGSYTREQVMAVSRIRDSWWTVLVLDPVAVRLVRMLANRTPATPNQLTAFSAFLAFAAAGGFLHGATLAIFTGIALFQLSLLVDCMDGKLARLTGQESVFGARAGSVAGRFRLLACSLALLAGQYSRTHQQIFVQLSVLVVGCFLVCLATGGRLGRVTIPSLARWRLRTRPVSEVEFGIAICVIAPETRFYFPVIVGAAALLIAAELGALLSLLRRS